VPPRVVRGSVQHGASEVHATKFAGGGLTNEHGARCPRAQQHGVRRFGDSILEDQTRIRVGPTGDVVQLLHADRHSTEREVDICTLCCRERGVTIEMTERIQVAVVDCVERGLEFLCW